MSAPPSKDPSGTEHFYEEKKKKKKETEYIASSFSFLFLLKSPVRAIRHLLIPNWASGSSAALGTVGSFSCPPLTRVNYSFYKQADIVVENTVWSQTSWVWITALPFTDCVLWSWASELIGWWQPIVKFSGTSQACWYDIGNLTSALIGVLTSWKLTKSINPYLPPSLTCLLLFFKLTN